MFSPSNELFILVSTDFSLVKVTPYCLNHNLIRKNIFACLFSVHNTISLSRHEQVCLMRLRFERYFSHHRADDGRSISRNVASLNILVHDVINHNLVLNLCAAVVLQSMITLIANSLCIKIVLGCFSVFFH